jgi:hypothetical protein
MHVDFFVAFRFVKSIHRRNERTHRATESQGELGNLTVWSNVHVESPLNLVSAYTALDTLATKKLTGW